MPIIAFKDVSVTVNSIALSDHTNSVTLNYEIESQDATVMGGQRAFIGGIQNNSLEVTLYQDFASASVEATIYPLVGTQTTVVLKPTSSAVSSTNPSYTLANTFLSAHTPIAAGDVGSTSPVTLTFTGGTLTKATS